MKNMKFKADDYISLNVGLEKRSGDPFVLGTLVGVCITGSGSASPINNKFGDPGYNGDKDNGVGNAPGYASVALAGGAEVNIPAGIQPAVIGETLYITSGGALTRTATGNTKFGKVTHLGRDNSTAIVKIVQ
jgi:hypothetical protein